MPAKIKPKASAITPADEYWHISLDGESYFTHLASDAKHAIKHGGSVTHYCAVPKREPVPATGSTYTERFTDAVTVLCGMVPPPDFVSEWIGDIEVEGAARLQHWMLSKGSKLPRWTQAIVALDAADVLAREPEEGADHQPKADPSEDFNAAIDYAIELADLSAREFLRCWREGDWETLAKEWPDFKLPSSAQVGAPE